MNIQRKKMDQALKTIVVPLLRKHGFMGTYPHFQRSHDGHLDLLMFQFYSAGGKFVVEIGYVDKGLQNVSGFEYPSYEVGHCKDRLRLYSQGKDPFDHWFAFPQFAWPWQNSYECIAKEVADLIATQAEEWWKEKR